MGEVLMDKRDEHETLYRAIAENFEVIDGILDEEIQENLDEAGPDGQEKVLEAAAMEGPYSPRSASGWGPTCRYQCRNSESGFLAMPGISANT